MLYQLTSCQLMSKQCNMGLCHVIWYWVLLHATAVTQGWNRYQNKSQHRKLTLGKKLLPLVLGLEPRTFWSQVQHSKYWVIPTLKYFVDKLRLYTTNICLSVCNFYGWELKISLNCTWAGFNYDKVSKRRQWDQTPGKQSENMYLYIRAKNVQPWLKWNPCKHCSRIVWSESALKIINVLE